MTSAEVEAYLDGLDEPRSGTLREVRRRILAILHDEDAREGMAYGAPVVRVGGKAVAGYAAFRDHLSYLPHSGAVTAALAAELAGYSTSKGSVRFAIDTPLPGDLLRLLIDARLAELGRPATTGSA